MLFLLLILPPLAACVLSIAVGRHGRALGWANVAGASVSLAASAAFLVRIATGAATSGGPDALWNVDALSGLLAACIALVTLLAAAFGPGLADTEPVDPSAVRRFRIFLNALVPS